MAIEATGREDIQFVVGGACMQKMIKHTSGGDDMVPADVTCPPLMIATATGMTAFCLTLSARLSGICTVGSVLVIGENDEDTYLPDPPF